MATLEVKKLESTAVISGTSRGQTSTVGSWIEYRDNWYGYGLALPCYWTLYTIPSQPDAVLTMASYDEAFFRAHAEKGEWIGGQWPTGAIKMDIMVFEIVTPTLSLPEAVRYLFNTRVDGNIELLEEKSFGSNSAIVAHFISEIRPGEKGRVSFFRLSPDRVLLVNALPDTALESSDVQGILSSLAVSRQAPVMMPSFPPAPPLGQIPAACVTKILP
jgi:hypothetical protein